MAKPVADRTSTGEALADDDRTDTAERARRTESSMLARKKGSGEKVEVVAEGEKGRASAFEMRREMRKERRRPYRRSQRARPSLRAD